MFTELSAWWMTQMLELVPDRLRGAIGSKRDAWLARVDNVSAPTAIDLCRRKAGQDTRLGRFNLNDADLARAIGKLRPETQLILELPPGQLLQRDVALPLAAEANLEQVLGYEMDRITPFPASAVYWNSRVQSRDRTAAQLQVRVCLIRRDAVAPILETLSRLGLRPTALSTAGADVIIPLEHGTAQTGISYRLRATALACAGLALAVCISPFAQNLLAIQHADSRIAALQPDVTKAEALRRRLAIDSDGADIFASETAKVGDPLRALAALTTVMPDDSWISALTLRQRVLTFSGQSRNAARLIGLLSADPALRNPAFATPVTKNEQSGADQFSIRAEFAL